MISDKSPAKEFYLCRINAIKVDASCFRFLKHGILRVFAVSCRYGHGKGYQGLRRVDCKTLVQGRAPFRMEISSCLVDRGAAGIEHVF